MPITLNDVHRYKGFLIPKERIAAYQRQLQFTPTGFHVRRTRFTFEEPSPDTKDIQITSFTRGTDMLDYGSFSTPGGVFALAHPKTNEKINLNDWLVCHIQAESVSTCAYQQIHALSFLQEHIGLPANLETFCTEIQQFCRALEIASLHGTPIEQLFSVNEKQDHSQKTELFEGLLLNFMAKFPLEKLQNFIKNPEKHKPLYMPNTIYSVFCQLAQRIPNAEKTKTLLFAQGFHNIPQIAIITPYQAPDLEINADVDETSSLGCFHGLFACFGKKAEKPDSPESPLLTSAFFPGAGLAAAIEQPPSRRRY